MGQKAMRECCVAGCHNLTRDGYCQVHVHLKLQRHSIYDRTDRDKQAAAFYKSDAWRKARALSMARHYGLCQDCLEHDITKDAVMVHHVKPLRQYPELALVQSNLRPLCNRCHAQYK